MTMNEFLINDTPVKIWTKAIEPTAYRQIYNLAALPFVFHHLAFMPDVHAIRSPKDLEEAASAYKNIDEVMANQSDLTKIVTTLEPIAVIKGV